MVGGRFVYISCGEPGRIATWHAKQFNRIITMLSEGITPANRAGAWLHRDVMAGQVESPARERELSPSPAAARFRSWAISALSPKTTARSSAR